MATSKMQRRKPGEHPVSYGTDKLSLNLVLLGVSRISMDNPRLFANRQDLISAMSFLKDGVIAEIGVADGFFSEFLLSELRPRKFVAFDLFTLHEFTTSWAGRTDMFGNMTQLEHYRRKFADRGPQVVIEVGMSQQNLAKYPDKSFD